MRRISCNNIYEAANLINHNTETIVRMIRRNNWKISRLRRSNHFWMTAGLIYGIAIELCLLSQSYKVKELEEKLDNLRIEIKELRDREGD